MNLLIKNSEARQNLLTALNNKEYSFIQYILSPEQIGIPNRRPRYYLIARSKNVKRLISNKYEIYRDFFTLQFDKTNEDSVTSLEEFLEINIKNDYEYNKNLYFKELYPYGIKSNYFPNVRNLDSNLSNCFTKSYGWFQKSSGSILDVRKGDYNIKEVKFNYLSFII